MDRLIDDLRLTQSFLQTRNAPVLNFGHLGQIAVTSRFFKGLPSFLKGLLDVRFALRSRFLALPNFIEIRVLALELLER